MINAFKNIPFPIVVALVDEFSGELVQGGSVSYDIRTIDDIELSPPISGSLNESTIENGIYKKEISIPITGSFICYATCSGFLTSTETILVAESALETYKYNLPYNTSVIDVPRNGVATPSQTARNVPDGKTDYIVTIIKHDSDLDWSSPVSSGISYAHYRTITDDLPYMMGAEF